MWRTLAPLMAARRSMRLSAPSDDGKFATSRTLTSRLPEAPAAVPLYNQHGRTVLLALDFDAKHHGAAQVDADVERVLAWLHECGGRTVTDRSTSGGRHVLVPLPTDTPLRVDDLRVLLTLLEERLPTFDKSPMLGSSTAPSPTRSAPSLCAPTAGSSPVWSLCSAAQVHGTLVIAPRSR